MAAYYGPQKIISGGQTGADRGGLEAGRALGLETGGTAPKNWMTEKGSDYSLAGFGLVEGPPGYPERTRKNVDDSDGTLVFRLHPGSGTDKTVGYAVTKKWIAQSRSSDNGYRPVLVLNSLNPDQMPSLLAFLRRNKISCLNVAGHRETTAGVPDFGLQVQQFLVNALGQF